MVGMARYAAPARVLAGGTNDRAALTFEGVAPLHVARTSQRDVPTTLNTYPLRGERNQMLTTIPVRWLEDNRGWRVETNLTVSGSRVGSWTFNVQRSTFNGVRLNLSVRPVAQPSRLRVPAPSRCEDDAGGETPPSLAGGDACATTDTTRFADTICDRAMVARSGLPRSADFSPLPSGSPEIAGSGLKSALRPELGSQSAAQASSLYRKSAQRDCQGSHCIK